MNKIVKSIVAFSLKNKIFILFATVVIGLLGAIAYSKTPIEAYPDITNTQIIIITQWQGRGAEEVERQITIPVELAMNSVQDRKSLHSITMFGLSQITIIFNDGVDDYHARAQVMDLLNNVQLPVGVQASVEPPYGPTDEIYRFTLQSKTKSAMELKTIEKWIIERNLHAVDGVADVNTYGGPTKTYEVDVNPYLLNKYGITALDVYNAISNSNINAGGDAIEEGEMSFVVRGIGLINNIDEIKNIIIKNMNGVPLLVQNVSSVSVSNMPRLGKVGMDTNNDVVQGVVVMRKGKNPQEILKGIRAKVDELNTSILPSDVKIVPFYDRSTLITYCTETVLHNLIEGILLVIGLVFLFMMDWRATLIVALVVPLSLLFAFICMQIKGMPVNLLSLGAVDFGIIIDGAVVLVEGCFVMFDGYYKELGQEKFNKRAKMGWIKNTSIDMGKAILFAKLIIITALIPIFSFEDIEGKIFSPLAWTLGFALLGALIFTLTLVPVLIHMLLNKNVYEKHNPIVAGLEKGYGKLFNYTFKHKRASLAIALVVLGGSLYIATFLGSEFLPHLDEGALWVEAQTPMGISLTQSSMLADSMRKDLLTFPEVRSVVSQTGRPDDGSDPKSFSDIQCNVSLYPQEDWKRKISKDSLIDAMSDLLNEKYEGNVFNFSQPIRDNVEEAVAGMNAALAVRISGDDINILNQKAEEVRDSMKKVPGIADLGILKNLGQPELDIDLEQNKMARYGVTTANANAIVQMAVGGQAATQVFEGERLFDLRVRYMPEFRKTPEELGDLMVPTLNGGKVPLKQISSITLKTGITQIFRTDNMRGIGVKFSVRNRDLGSAIADAKEKTKNIKFPKGYKMDWVGEFQSQVRAVSRLKQVVPISLLLIFVILFVAFGNFRDSTIILLNVPFALIGGIFALLLTNTNFSISAGIGFIALFGVCIQNGVILLVQFKRNLHKKQSLVESIHNGVRERVRPVVMTALIDMVGLFPAAISTGIGSEAQKPLAIVMIGGLVSATILVLLILPIIYYMVYHPRHRMD
ncbi:MAG TPA: CusA/CzcA family heavy metal efflux RND transporter [Bacteroidia bacterium]|jgi:cobalt-zinc-cadmium resistance protein CzcA|nr:CusA/CzcA family heavy metal efflux RND transporter [Bacteroidia bacterium]